MDRDGDGYISIDEVGVLLQELGVDAGVGGEQMQGEAPGPEQETGQQLLAALANKQHTGVTFTEFLQFNSQVCAFGPVSARSLHPV